MKENRCEYYLVLANHWSYTGIGWLLGLESCRNSIEDSLNTADVYPHVKVCINLDARAYEAVKKYFPETIERLKKYLKEGKTEIIGGTYGQPMGSMIGNESVIRQLTEGRKVVEKVLDFDMPSFLEEEEFTFPQLPQLLLQSGFRYASLAQCDTWGKVGAPVMDHSRIRWEGKDGSCIPALPRTKLYFHPPCVTSDVQELLTDKMRGNIRELTEKRAMGSVPFGGRYRLIDFPLSNMVNSGINKVHLIDGRVNHTLLLEIFTDHGVGTQIVRPDSVM